MHLKSILWNLLGLGLPLLVAAVTVPQLITSIGQERFGLLALAWGLIGYAGALDLGIGRATTQRIASLLGIGMVEQIPKVVHTATVITMCSGVVGMAALFLFGVMGGYGVISVSTVEQNELLWSTLLLGVALPFQAMSATYRGVNEAYLNFRGISLVRLILGVANFGVPFVVSYFTVRVDILISSLVLSRLIAYGSYRRLATSAVKWSGVISLGALDKHELSSLLKFGGWVSVSGVVGPLLVQADRFVIGAMISAAAVTFYVIPWEVAVQSLVLVGAISSVAFPAISKLISVDRIVANRLFNRWLIRVAILMGCVTAGLAFGMRPLLNIWVGELVSPDSILVGQILCVGVFFNSIGAMYYALLHAQGLSKQTAILHIFELPIYILLLIVLIDTHGIVGCAIAWVARAAADAFALTWISARMNIMVKEKSDII